MARKLRINGAVMQDDTGEELKITTLDDASLNVVSVTVSVGEEVYSPVQYQSFRVGGHSLTFIPKPGVDLESQVERASCMLAELIEQEFDVRFRKFGDRIKRSSNR